MSLLPEVLDRRDRLLNLWHILSSHRISKEIEQGKIHESTIKQNNASEKRRRINSIQSFSDSNNVQLPEVHR